MKEEIKISFVIPVLNEEKRIRKCLSSIRRQNYPQDKVEILIVDGSSSDKTLEIAKEFNVRIINNPKKLAEYGVQLGILNARGELATIFAADNELYSENWIRRVIEVFEKNKEVSAVWGRLISGEDDPPINKYFELIQNDPFSFFMNKNLNFYLKTGERRGDYVVFRVSPKRPLVWGANGLTYRLKWIREIWNTEDYLGDNDAFHILIERGKNKVVYFSIPFVYHHHIRRLDDWVKKWRRNFLHHLLDKWESRNINWILVQNFKIKLIVWLIYSLLPIFSLIHSLKNALLTKNKYWLYHPIVCFMQSITYIYLILSTKKGRKVLYSILSH